MILIGLRTMKLRYLLALLYVSHIGWAQAEIYKFIDAEGHVTYSSTPTKGAKKLGLESQPPPPVPALPAAPRARSEATPSDFPKVDSSTQKSRDNARHKILADELSTEENLLAEARQNLKVGEESPEYERDNYHRPVLTARYKEKMSALQEQVTLHEKNIAALKSELANLK